ncbi:MAG: hypothetical protein Q8S58_15100 [Bosea sp. (in: a-proteobacteria)]|uniref:hypothetical protein n=1 Tax=Bosea sp. (in: a-proteobacteria) TaxID=1871050 RepID=UPI002736B8AA|nr:hypothetical protein [Bosea sp. (in: a-proteobacteria)]MDP3258833.1 hypothetical protein [Bosea sp. (in: a-proteobacteria)]MDP3320451.1 hypothetical protein [Bosea sp. (in: a-proteobacteria)]
MLSIPVPDIYAQHIRALLEASSDLDSLLQQPGWDKPDCLSVKDFTSFLTPALSASAASAFVFISMSLLRMMERRSSDFSTITSGIGEGLKEKGWQSEDIDRLSSILKKIEPVIVSEKIKVLSKASDIFYSTNYHLHNYKIYTGMKPVFNTERDDIAGFIVTSQLMVQISDGIERDLEYYIDVGPTELRSLRDEIDRALKKLDIIDRRAADWGEKVIRYDNE